MRFLNSWKIPFVCASVSVAAGVVLLLMFRHPTPTGAVAVGAEPPVPGVAAPATTPAAKAAAGAPGDQAEISLGDALGRRWLEASYRGNGRDDTRVTLQNRAARPLRVTLTAGVVLESPDLATQVVLARDATIELPAGEKTTARVFTAATRLGNRLADQPLALSPAGTDALPTLKALLDEVRRCPEASRDAIAAAVLLVNQNPGLGTLAKFNLLTGEPPKGVNAEAFRVGTVDLLAALTLLKDAGYPRASLLVVQEPQLKIEAMIDPLAHAAAMRFYNIAPEKEWTYWKEELLHGDASTRHYALYGIGRYFPDVALQMLPDWARDKRVSAIFRQSAIQALAETRRPEAISVLQQLVNELGANTDLGLSARRATAYLEHRRDGVPDIAAVAGLQFKLTQVETR